MEKCVHIAFVTSEFWRRMVGMKELLTIACLLAISLAAAGVVVSMRSAMVSSRWQMPQ